MGTCACLYRVSPGDTCLSIAYQKGITEEAVLRLNPSVDSDCTNLVDGQVSGSFRSPKGGILLSP